MPITLNLTSPGGIDFAEGARGLESPQMELSPDSWAVTRVYICKWADRIPFSRELLGGITPALVWTPPLTDTDLPALPARSVSLRPLGKASDDGQKAIYPYAVLTVRFESTEGDKTDSSVGHLTEALDYTVDILQEPTGKFSFVKDNPVYDDDGVQLVATPNTITAPADELTLPEQPGRPLPSAEYRLDLDKHPTPPWSDISTLMAKVNNATFNPIGASGLSFAAGTLLFAGVNSERQIIFDPNTGADTPGWKLSYSFMFRRVPHNFLFNGNPDLGGVGWSLPSPQPFSTADFNLLIQ